MKKDKPNIKELQESSCKLSRLMTRHLGISGPSETHYEDACHEVGRLKGIEYAMEQMERILRR